jgi:NADH-quinone oxidoreductase subunit D
MPAGAEILHIPIGQGQPALNSKASFEIKLHGEVVVSARLLPGFDQRGVEKAAERRSWNGNLELLANIFSLCPHAHALAYCLGVERLAGLEAPPRARSIRLLVAELERIQNHLLWLGAVAYQAGKETLFVESWQAREAVLAVFEVLSGKRVAYSPNRVGGVAYDLPDRVAADIRPLVDRLEDHSRHFLQQVVHDPFLGKRTRGVGVTTRSQAEKLGLVGPTARGSGVERDIRLDAPYSGYERYATRIVLDYAGDLQARLSVRLKELGQSCELVRRILDDLPSGPLAVKAILQSMPAGETISRVEAPCGELFYFIKSNGSYGPERIKIRTPAQSNLISVPAQAPGHHLADVPLLLAGVDPSISFHDSTMVISGQHGPHPAWTWDDLRAFGIAHYGGKTVGN